MAVKSKDTTAIKRGSSDEVRVATNMATMLAASTDAAIAVAGMSVGQSSTYEEAWKDCRDLGKRLSKALAAAGDVEYAFIQPSDMSFAVTFGSKQTGDIEGLIKSHRSALETADQHWNKVSEIEDGINDRLPFVRVHVGTRYRMDREPEAIWAYDEEAVIKKTDGHIRGALSEQQRRSYLAIREKKLVELRQLQAESLAIRNSVGLPQMESEGRRLDNIHREAFEALKATRPISINEARLKVTYIADHLTEMGEAMDEEEAIKLIRSLL